MSDQAAVEEKKTEDKKRESAETKKEGVKVSEKLQNILKGNFFVGNGNCVVEVYQDSSALF